MGIFDAVYLDLRIYGGFQLSICGIGHPGIGLFEIYGSSLLFHGTQKGKLLLADKPGTVFIGVYDHNINRIIGGYFLTLSADKNKMSIIQRKFTAPIL